MKFSIGYKIMNTTEYVDEIIKLKDHISEVYFSWADFPNGRNNQLAHNVLSPWEAQRIQEEDLKKLSDAGICLNILFNAMCYGQNSQSRAFFKKIGESVDYLKTNYNLSSVTTTSPLIARFIDENFEDIDIRASVNMEIGTVEAMEYIKDYFKSFYLKRELNRNFNEIKKMKKWCDENGKTLYALANSGCLNNCSAHVFHDNLVAHENEIAKMDNAYAFEGICRQFFEKEENMKGIVENTSYIRPEDIHMYEEFFTSMKLASRVSKNPINTLHAYIKGSYSGNVCDLLEPNHSGSFYPYIIENSSLNANTDNGLLKYINFEESIRKLEDILC